MQFLSFESFNSANTKYNTLILAFYNTKIFKLPIIGYEKYLY